MDEIETMDAITALSRAQNIVKHELDSLHMDKRDRDDLIKSQQEQIRIMRERSADGKDRVDVMADRMMQESRNADRSTFFMCVSWVITLGVIAEWFVNRLFGG